MSRLWTGFVFVSVAAIPLSADLASTKAKGLEGGAKHEGVLERMKGGSLVVNTNSGRVKGVKERAVNGKDVFMWWGIPYAEPPVGELRFRKPVPIKRWKGVKNAQEKPNTCIQIKDVLFPGFPGAEMWNPNTELSEDCLYLNIAVPASLPSNKSASVMVWIYGGSYYAGTSTLDVYDPKTLATEQNIIVASLQYRVASLGFLYLGTSDVPGNQGLLDQRMALKWIKDNIQFFGGNPESITLFSESAGSASVAFQLLSPGSRHLFTRASMQSAAATNPWAMVTKKEAKLRALRLAEVLGCPHSSTDLGKVSYCLRHKNATKLVDGEWNGIVFGMMGCPFVPVFDGAFFPESPARALSRRNFKPTQILLGVNKDEGHYFNIYYLLDIFKKSEKVAVTREEFEDALRELNLFVNPMGIEAINYEYTTWTKPNNSKMLIDALDKMVGDYQFVCPTLEFAQRYAAASNDVYLYYFNHRSSQNPWPKWAGVMHGDEINFIFGEPLNKTDFNYTAAEVQLSKTMMTYWANFARTGNPNTFSNGTWMPKYWPLHTVINKEYLMLSKNISQGKGHRSRKCAFWKNYLPKVLAAYKPKARCQNDDSCSGSSTTCSMAATKEGTQPSNGPDNLPGSLSAGSKKPVSSSDRGQGGVPTVLVTLVSLLVAFSFGLVIAGS